MRFVAALMVVLVGTIGLRGPVLSGDIPGDAADARIVSGPFSSEELREFVALRPIDAHTHAYQNAPEFFVLLQRLNLHTLDILVAVTPKDQDLTAERTKAWKFVGASGGRVSLCTTFNPFDFSEPGFSKAAIGEINEDFDRGAVAAKIWKNVGKEVRRPDGTYLLPDDPVFSGIYADIAMRHKTLIAHLADPDEMWEVQKPGSPGYARYRKNPQWYMFNRPGAPPKAEILLARDHVLQQNPTLRVVGAHLGSMEGNFKELGEHLDRYPNFAVDFADRIGYFMQMPRQDAISFITRYQDRLLYGTDNEFPEFPPAAKASTSAAHWEATYALDWRFLATDDVIEFQGKRYRGLGLSKAILLKLYHDNAVRWLPGVEGSGD